jgi:hypothetical protein
MGALLSGTVSFNGGRRAAGTSVTDASSAIGLSRSTIQRRLRSKDWPGGKSGRKWLVSTPFVQAVTDLLRASPLFDVDAFAANWMASGVPAEPGARVPARLPANEPQAEIPTFPSLQEAVS